MRIFWLDEAEPEYTAYDFDNYRYYLGPNTKVGNSYPLFYAKTFFDGMRAQGQENIINLPLPGLVKVAAITTIIAGITGSASGGLTIALELFGETFISWGYTPEIIHRVASIACGGLDTLPWNGTVVMLFALSGVSYKKGYKHVAMETVILPLLSLIPVFIYYSIVH